VEIAMSAPPVIQLTSLTKRYGSTPAVDDLTWSGGRGVIGLLGPNGAGKSTLLRMLATVLAHDSGEVRVFGLDPAVAGERLAIRRRLGYLPQEAGLYRNFTAYDLVDYVAVLKEITDRPTRRDEVRRVLDDVGLADDMHRRIRTLSGGMQRRVALAAALLGHPDLVVLDEPSAGLDPDQRLRLRAVLSEVGRRGTVLLSTHQTDEVAAFCQRVLVVERGRLLFDGAPGDLAKRAADRVWISDEPDAGALRSWVTSDGDIRNIGMPPPGASVVDPTLDDGYLLVTTEEGART
jgi:ABC-2 type transport system ATP-binding protein